VDANGPKRLLWTYGVEASVPQSRLHRVVGCQLIEPLRVSVEWVEIPIVGEADAYLLRLVVDI